MLPLLNAAASLVLPPPHSSRPPPLPNITASLVTASVSYSNHRKPFPPISLFRSYSPGFPLAAQPPTASPRPAIASSSTTASSLSALALITTSLLQVPLFCFLLLCRSLETSLSMVLSSHSLETQLSTLCFNATRSALFFFFFSCCSRCFAEPPFWVKICLYQSPKTVTSLLSHLRIGFNVAASVRVSNELGAGNPKSAAFSVLVVTMMSFILSIIIAIAVLCARDHISYIFNGSERVAKAVSDLCPLLATTIIRSGIQPVLSGVAVGCGWQVFVAYINVICYYFIGVAAGILLGFEFGLGLGVKGIWGGMIGGTFLQTIILFWVTIRTNWNDEVQRTQQRLNKWDDKKQPLLAENGY